MSVVRPAAWVTPALVANWLESALLLGLWLSCRVRRLEIQVGGPLHGGQWLEGPGWAGPPALDYRLYCAWCQHPVEEHNEMGCHHVEREAVGAVPCVCILARSTFPDTSTPDWRPDDG